MLIYESRIMNPRTAKPTKSRRNPSEQEDSAGPGYTFQKEAHRQDFIAGFQAGIRAYDRDHDVHVGTAQKAYRRVRNKHGSFWIDGYAGAIDYRRGVETTASLTAERLGLFSGDKRYNPMAKKKNKKTAAKKAGKKTGKKTAKKTAKKAGKKAGKKTAAKKAGKKTAAKKAGKKTAAKGPSFVGAGMAIAAAEQRSRRDTAKVEERISQLAGAKKASGATIAALEKKIRALRARVGAERRRGDLTAAQEQRLKDQLAQCTRSLGECKIAAATSPKTRKGGKKGASKARGPLIEVGVVRVSSTVASERKKAAAKSRGCATSKKAVKCQVRPTQATLAACRRAHESWQNSDRREAKKKKSPRATCGPGVPSKRAAGFLGGKAKGKVAGKPRKVTPPDAKKIMRDFMKL